MIKKYICLLAACLCVSAYASAQNTSAHEFGVSIGGGLSTLKYDDGKNGIGGNIALNYTYLFNEKWGIKSGLELALYNAKLKDFSTLSYAPGLKDSEGEIFDYYSSVSGYTEKQKAMLLNIPVMGYFQTEAFSQNKFYVSAGFKVGIPVSGKYESDGETFVNKGWYPNKNNWVETQKFAGFGEFKDKSVEDDLDLDLAFILSLEAGLKWDLGGNKSLYTGVFLDYGLNDIRKYSNKPFVTQTVDGDNYDFTNNSALESTYATKYVHEQGEVKKIADKVVPFAVGIKIGFALF